MARCGCGGFVRDLGRGDSGCDRCGVDSEGPITDLMGLRNGNAYTGIVGLTNAERQRRYRERRRAAVPIQERAVRPPRPKARPARWTAAVDELQNLQAEYGAWRDGLPESLASSRTAELLGGVCDLDLDDLGIELPRGFGRD